MMETLKGKQVFLRAMEPSDVSILYEWENNPVNWKVSETHAPFSLHLLEQYVNGENDIFVQKQLRFMICKIDSNVAIGTVDLFEFDPMNLRAGIGILIADPENRRKGNAEEALRLMIQYSFNLLKLHQLYCNIQSGNQRSLNLFKKLGFELIGTKKEWRMEEYKWEDELMFQLINK